MLEIKTTDSTGGVNWTPVYEECIYIPRSRIEHAIHKIEQTLKGEYPEGQALEAALASLRAYTHI